MHKPIHILFIATCSIGLMLFSIPSLRAQENLVPNGGFEDYVQCPIDYGAIFWAAPWLTASNASPDFFHACAPPNLSGVPQNANGYQVAHSGLGYGGEIFITYGNGYREYMRVPLTESLEGGVPYEVGMWVNLSETQHSDCATNGMGMYLSAEPIPVPHPTFQGGYFLPAQLEYTGAPIADTINWTLVSGCIVAEGGEQHLTIGNFSPAYQTGDGCEGPSGYSYYYIDDVYVKKSNGEGLEIEMADSVILCDEYEIDPDVEPWNVTYQWSDGSDESTLTVFEGGMYYLTIVEGCRHKVDSILVIQPAPLPDNLLPPYSQLCSGESVTLTVENNSDFTYLWEDGSSNNSITLSTPGMYSVTVSNGCETEDDVIDVEINEPPPPFDFEQTHFCHNQPIEITFDPDLGAFLWQDSSISPNYTIEGPGFYAVTITNLCGTESAAVTLSELFPPIVSLDPDTTVRCIGDTVHISLPQDPLEHTFTWSNGNQTPMESIIMSGVYVVTVSNVCGNAIDSLNATFLLPPQVHLGNDTLLCDGAPPLWLEVDSVSNTQYQWQDGSVSNAIIAPVSGIYVLTVTNLCGNDVDSIHVTWIDSLPTIELGPDQGLCPNATLAVHINAQDNDVLWQDQSTADSLLITQAGTYFATLYNACFTLTDTIHIALNELPEVMLPPDEPLCHGDSIVLTATNNETQLLWNTGDTSASITVHQHGWYVVIASNTCGTITDSVLIVDNGPYPAVQLGDDPALCPGETFLLNPASSAVDTWLWHTGETTPTLLIAGGDTSIVHVYNQCGTATDTVIAIALPPVPTFSLGPDTALCSFETMILSVSVPDVTVTWTDGSQLSQFVVSEPGMYAATIDHMCGNVADTILIGLLPDIPDLSLGNDQSVCPGEVIVVDPGIENVTYLWQDGSTLPTYTTTQPEIITLTIVNSCGEVSDTLILAENLNGPDVDLGPDISGCAGEVVTIESGILGVDYVWQDGSTQPFFVASTSGMVVLMVSNLCGDDVDTLQVDLSGIPPTISLGPDTVVCEGEQLQLNSESSGAESVVWQDGSIGQSFETNLPGLFWVIAENDCGSKADTMLVSALSAPEPFVLGHDTVLCPGESILLTAPPTSFDLQWQNGSSDHTMVADQTQTYSLRIFNQCGEENAAMKLLINTDQPVVHLDSYPWCPNDTITLNAVQSFPAIYNWSTGAVTPSITVQAPGYYTVTVAALCTTVFEDTDIIREADCGPAIVIPNVISPNGDGINDVLSLFHDFRTTLLSMDGTIYDRWGNILHASDEIPFTWNGTRNNEVCHPGVYVYLIHVRYMHRGSLYSETLAGDVTLMK